MLQKLKKDWLSLFLPTGLLLTIITILPSLGPVGMMLAFPAFVGGYIFTLVVGDYATGSLTKTGIINRSKQGGIAFIAALFTAGMIAPQGPPINELAPLSYMMVVLPILLVLGLGITDFSSPQTIFYPLMGWMLGCCLVWIASILLDLVSTSWSPSWRIFSQAILLMPALCLPAWLGAHIRQAL